MKKIILELLLKRYDLINANWCNSLQQLYKDKLSIEKLNWLVKQTLQTIIKIIENSDYEIGDDLLIELYNIASENHLDLLQVSHLFSSGRVTLINVLEKDIEKANDQIILLGFIEEIMEHVFVRYSILHQEAKMKEIKMDRDLLASKLETNQKYLQNILLSSDTAFTVLDENDRFIAWNKGAEKIFGYAEEEILGKEPDFLFPNTEKFQDELKIIRTSVIEKGHFQILETERVAKDGSIIPVQLKVSILTNEKGEYAGRFAIIKDYTELKRLQQQLDQSEKLAILGQMAAGIAHEIGNPLTSISAIVQIIQRKSHGDFYNEQLAHVKENIDRISKIVRELVDFSRPPSYEKTLIHIAEIINTAAGIVKYDKRVKDVDFVFEVDPEMPKIIIVPDQLLQVIVNILFNALDAIDGNGKIFVTARNDASFIYIDIKDNGHGIKQRDLDKIFTPFFTTKGVGKGTGLGLSVSYGIIKKFNGDISVVSEINIGSTFTIKLPLNN